MDTKNVIAAISLSAAVIVLYSLFFAPTPLTNENLAEKNKIEQNTDTPSLDQKENMVKITREEALDFIKEENKPRYQNMVWYLEACGLDFETVVKKINSTKKIFQ